MTTTIARFVVGLLLVILFVLGIAAADGIGTVVGRALAGLLR